jgi:hypothetical protein
MNSLLVLHRRRVDVEEGNKENKMKDKKRKSKRKMRIRGKISTTILDIIEHRIFI